MKRATCATCKATENRVKLARLALVLAALIGVGCRADAETFAPPAPPLPSPSPVSQTGAVYDAETPLRGRTVNPRVLIRRVVEACEIAPVRFRLIEGRGSASHSERLIRLPRASSLRILHELAHLIVRDRFGEQEPHGPEYAGTMLALVTRFDPSMADDVARRYRTEDVEVGPSAC